jgi:hypothetical protein
MGRKEASHAICHEGNNSKIVTGDRSGHGQCKNDPVKSREPNAGNSILLNAPAFGCNLFMFLYRAALLDITSR